MKSVRLALVMMLAAGFTACDLSSIMGADPTLADGAKAKLRSGDLAGASAEAAQVVADNPGHLEASITRAFTQVMAGDYEGADATLKAAEDAAGDRLGEVKLRRALVAMRAGDVDSVKTHASASGLPEGKLLAAEVLLVDLEADQAAALLREISGVGGVVGSTAQEYLRLLDSDDQIQQGLAEASALWALGVRRDAVGAAGELVRELPDDDSELKSALMLTWAGRAVTSGDPATATALLDDILDLPQDQQWRLQATRALVMVAEGDAAGAKQMLDGLEAAGAPKDGLADARATAAALSTDRAAAKDLVSNVESPAAARGLLKAGAPKAAAEKVSDGNLKSFLENR